MIHKISEKIDSTLWKNSDLQEWAQKNASNAPEWVAEVLSQANQKEYNDALLEEFGQSDKKLSVIHALLSLLPFKGYITTDYYALMQNGVYSKVLSQML